jgi:hypothetical protein
MNMILEGPNIQNKSAQERTPTNAALAISQLCFLILSNIQEIQQQMQ